MREIGVSAHGFWINATQKRYSRIISKGISGESESHALQVAESWPSKKGRQISHNDSDGLYHPLSPNRLRCFSLAHVGLRMTELKA